MESGEDENRREGMRAVAEETGGLAVIDRNDIDKGLQRVLADNELYYLLAYQPTSSGRPGRFRRIEVRLPGRPGLVARTRRGYFEVAPEAAARKTPSPEDPGAALRERARDALTSIVPLSAVPVRLAADFVDLPEAGPVVVVNVGIDVADVRRRYLAAAPSAGIEVVGVVTTQDGEAVEQFTARVPLEESREPVGIDRPGTRIVRRWLPLRPGRFQVRVAALAPRPADAGSASQWVEVPDLSTRRLRDERPLPLARGRRRTNAPGTSPPRSGAGSPSAARSTSSSTCTTPRRAPAAIPTWRSASGCCGKAGWCTSSSPARWPATLRARPRAFPGARAFPSRTSLPASTSYGPSSRTGRPRPRPSAA